MAKPIPHGTTNGYKNYKCRCQRCRDAAAAFTRDLRLRNAQRPLPEVPHGRNGYDNFNCRCGVCCAAYSEYKRRRREVDGDRMRAIDNAWYAANRERRKQLYRDLYERDKELRKPKYAAYYRENRETKAARGREWIAANADRHREYQRHFQATRRARVRLLQVYEFTESDWLKLCRRFDNRCAYCGARKRLTIDHVVPISRGGSHSVGNLLPACGPCNSSKGAKFLTEWRTMTPIDPKTYYGDEPSPHTFEAQPSVFEWSDTETQQNWDGSFTAGDDGGLDPQHMPNAAQPGH